MIARGDAEHVLRTLEYEARHSGMAVTIHVARSWYLTVVVHGISLGYWFQNWVHSAIHEGLRYGWVDRDYALHRMELAQYGEEPPI